ncbi:MAG: MFS transporter [Thermomicrobiales bacterium]
MSSTASSPGVAIDAPTTWRVTFHRVWAALTVALFGAQISTLALPLGAALSLGASPLQMGLLVAAGEAPFLLCSLPCGVLVDRVRRWPLLIAADLSRAGLLSLIPLAALLGGLRLELLYVVAFLTGAGNVLFDVAHYAYIPALVPRSELLRANGRIQVSYSAAESAGPGLAGVLIQAVSAPLAMLATAGTYLISAALLGSNRRPETPASLSATEGGMREAIMAGLRALLNQPLLRPIVLTSAAIGVCQYAVRAVFVLYVTRELGLDALQIGAILAVGGIAAAPGGLLADRVGARFGSGPAIWGGWLGEGAALLLLPFATPATAIPLLVAAQTLGGLAGTIANVNQWSLRQTLTPDHLQGRVTASHRFLVYGAFPLGALLGGVLASAIGLRPALFLGALGATLLPLCLLRTPLRGRIGR